MIGLIKKDFLMMKNNFKILGVILLVYAVLIFQDEISFSFIPPFISFMLMLSTFSYDNYNNWDSYAITLPGSRKNIVKSKYLSAIILTLLTSIIITILAMIASYTKAIHMPIEEILVTMGLTALATICVQAIMYPIIFKFGIEKARIAIFLLVFGIAFIGGTIIKFIDLKSFISIFHFFIKYYQIIIPIVVFLLLLLSYKLSEFFYQKKEF